MRGILVPIVVAGLLSLCISAQANVFNLGSGLTNLETVRVGDAGNVGEISDGGGSGYARTCGAVSYEFNVGKYEVTTAQYVDFLNHKATSDPYGLWNSNMADIVTSVWGCNIQRHGASGSYTYSVGDGSATDAANWGNRPVNQVSFWNTCRFANWLNNGQGNADTETGAYTLGGYNGSDGRSITRNANWTWAVTSEDEWYKSAYYKGGGLNAGYWDFPTQSDAPPVATLQEPSPANCANYCLGNGYLVDPPYYRNNVGEFENTRSYYGTFDQCGNVCEWTEGLVSPMYPNRVFKGGSYCSGYGWATSDQRYGYYNPCYGSVDSGFRVVQAVPEPSTVLLLIGGVAFVAGRRRREP